MTAMLRFKNYQWGQTELPTHLSFSQFSTPCPSAVDPMATLQKRKEKLCNVLWW